LKPDKHYIPVKQDLSDLLEKIDWARKNDAVVQQIAKNAGALVAQWITPEIMYCYYVRAIELYR